jgi:hypothetical protein
MGSMHLWGYFYARGTFSYICTEACLLLSSVEVESQTSEL